jgi:hypothetical protein
MTIKNRKKAPGHIDLCVNIDNGSVASSPNFHWTTRNALKSDPNPTHKPITFEDVQASKGLFDHPIEVPGEGSILQK